MRFFNREKFAIAALVACSTGAIYGVYKIDFYLSEEVARYSQDNMVRKQSLLNKGFYQVATLDSYPRPTLINNFCGSFDHVVVDTRFHVVDNPLATGKYILFCEDELEV